MGEKKKWISELLGSDEVSKYFRDLFNEQTDEIRKCISDIRSGQNEEELQILRTRLEYAKQKNEEICKRENEIQHLLKDAREDLEKKEKNIGVLHSKIIGLEEHIKTLNEELLRKNLEIDSLNEKYRVLEKENVSVLQRKDDEIESVTRNFEKTKSELVMYKSCYQELDEAWRNYQALSQESRNRLRNIFESDSIYGIVGACVDWRNVEGIWAFAKRRIIEKELDDVDKLIFLFKFLFNAHNIQCGQFKYELIEPKCGEKFDSDLHNILGIQTDGWVSVVRLAGIRDIKEKQVIQKALIEV